MYLVYSVLVRENMVTMTKIDPQMFLYLLILNGPEYE
jgi:hypothetical protein